MTAGAATPVLGLHVLADDDPRWALDPVAQARAACLGGTQVVQLRAKHATDRQVLAWAAAIRAITRRYRVVFFMNDRFDLALAAGADGVHLGQDDLPPGRLPQRARRRLRVGLSTHSTEQVRAACAQEVDYVAYGPIFATPTQEKAGEGRGLEALSEAARLAAPLPLVAIGGIDAERARRVVEAGAAGLAVISAVAAAPDPVAATRALARWFAAGADR
ncbi:MAG: thiamine phosphate synthase [Myxococcota bacterium]